MILIWSSHDMAGSILSITENIVNVVTVDAGVFVT